MSLLAGLFGGQTAQKEPQQAPEQPATAAMPPGMQTAQQGTPAAPSSAPEVPFNEQLAGFIKSLGGKTATKESPQAFTGVAPADLLGNQEFMSKVNFMQGMSPELATGLRSQEGNESYLMAMDHVGKQAMANAVGLSTHLFAAQQAEMMKQIESMIDSRMQTSQTQQSLQTNPMLADPVLGQVLRPFADAAVAGGKSTQEINQMFQGIGKYIQQSVAQQLNASAIKEQETQLAKQKAAADF